MVELLLDLAKALILGRIRGEPDPTAKGRSLARMRGELESIRGARGAYPEQLKELVRDGSIMELPGIVFRGEHQGTNAASSLKSLKDPSAGDTGGWGYVANRLDKDFGALFIDCTHTDPAGRKWDSY